MMLKQIFEKIVYVLAAIGALSLLLFAYSLLRPCVHCKGPYTIFHAKISNTRALAQMRQDSGKSLEGFCDDLEKREYFSKISKSLIVECKVTENSFTIIGRDSEHPDWNPFCADGKGNAISTKSMTQDGVECK